MITDPFQDGGRGEGDTPSFISLTIKLRTEYFVHFLCIVSTPQAALTGEAKGTREATKQLGEHVKALGAAYSSSESNMDALCQSLRRLEARQEEQHLFAGGITEQLVARQHTQARKGAVSVRWAYEEINRFPGGCGGFVVRGVDCHAFLTG